jgi:hypothetical protein
MTEIITSVISEFYLYEEDIALLEMKKLLQSEKDS